MKNLKIKQIAIGVGILSVGILLGKVFFNGPAPVNHQDHQHETIADVWTCSMHPQIRESGPGKCPLCGMDLIPVTTGTSEALDINQVQMTEAALKLAEVQTVVVGRAVPEKQVYLLGRIEADERGIANVTAHFSGRVEELYADFTGQYIRRGQRMATLYSPDLVTAQKELFEAYKFKTTNPSFYEAAVQKLKLWELTDRQIQSILEGGEPQYNFSVYAPRSGTIISREISEGEHVMDGQTLFEIADLNRLWVLFDAYESDLPWIRVGDSISFKVQSLSGRTFNSVVTFIDPVVNNQTRTASVRTEILNIDKQLKPAMFVEGIVNARLNTSETTISIPKTAVLWTGKRAVVYVKQPEFTQPTFEFREIGLGTDAGEYYLVNDGLAIGEEIVANGVFKIDGAAQLQGKISMMNPEGGRISTVHQHQDKTSDEQASETALKLFSVSDKFKSQIKGIFTTYLPLSEAMVQSDVNQTHNEAAKLLASIHKVDMQLVTGEAHQEWMSDAGVLTSAVKSLAQAEDIDGLRKTLPLLSDQLYQTLVKFQVETGGFRMFCPMAFETHGAFWLSASEEIRNPYMGQRMLTCGNIEQELK
jgi:Cu(I)/Ag(I) efflux system membrane fusion protein